MTLKRSHATGITNVGDYIIQEHKVFISPTKVKGVNLKVLAIFRLYYHRFVSQYPPIEA